jgi:hypothetical protein
MGLTSELRKPAHGPAAVAAPAGERRRPPEPVFGPWVHAQSVNVSRHAAALRPFADGEFGTGAAAPSRAHVQAVNDLFRGLRENLLQRAERVRAGSKAAERHANTATLERLLLNKDAAHDQVRAIERVWDFYFELFGQRQSEFAEWLLACDRIALDCYQVAFMNTGVAKSIPAPAPFCYMRTGFAPATFRRAIPLRRLGHLLNPFPLVQLPYHRLVNPWTLGALNHELSHNLQNDLGLGRTVPRAVAHALLAAGLPHQVAATWTRWNREAFADLCGLLLGGPGIVGSLFDVIGRAPATVFGYLPKGAHPTPYLRGLLNVELLRRMGFSDAADRYARLWRRLYPDPSTGTIPPPLLRTAETAIPVFVDAVCYQALPELGGKQLAQVLRFGQKDYDIVSQAAERLAAGNDPGIVPERFLIGAARHALDHRLARPGVIAKNFYEALGRR